METINALGRRKSSVARVYLTPGTGVVVINGRTPENFFPLATQRAKLYRPFELTDNVEKYDVKVNVKGGGTTGQVEAIRLGVARALVKIDAEYKPLLKAESLMTRDPRMVERKKFGQPKARKQFQFSKR
jgi:small subunit ribosomal protein S9